MSIAARNTAAAIVTLACASVTFATPAPLPAEQQSSTTMNTVVVYGDDARAVQDLSHTGLNYLQPFDLSYRAPDLTPEFAQFGSTFDQKLGSVSLNVAASNNPLLHPLTRLDTAITRDLRNHSIQLRLGDSINNSGGWDHAVRFGGLQVGTLQGTPADAIVSPELSAAGMAVVPTSADVLLNRSAGLPHVNGNGQVTMAVNDLLGRPHEITRPLFSDSPLMGKGQFGYSFSMGHVRENYLLEDNDYGKRLASGTVRYGVNKLMTVDLHAAQLEGDVSVVGGTVSRRTSQHSVMSATYAGSRTATDQGWLARAGYQYDFDGLSLAVRSKLQSAAYRDIGTLDAIPVQKRTLASAAMKMGTLGNVAVAGVSQTYIDQTSMDYVSLSHSIALNSVGLLTTSVAYAPVNETASGFLISFTRPFGGALPTVDSTFTRADVLTYTPVFSPTAQTTHTRRY